MGVSGSCISEGCVLLHSLAAKDQGPGPHHGIIDCDGCCLGSWHHMGIASYNADVLLDVDKSLFPWCSCPVCGISSIETFHHIIKKLLPYLTQIKC